jgi:hypothetical protein
MAHPLKKDSTMTVHARSGRPTRVRLDNADYPVDALGPEGQALLENYAFADQQLRHLHNMQAILNKARNAYIADLKDEILRARSGLDFSDLLADD